MRKKLVFIIIGGTVLLTCIVMAIVFREQKNGDNFHQYKESSTTTPQPTRVEKEDGEMNEQRNAFFEQMHLAAPGTNWKKMDADLRYKKMKERAAHLQYKTESGEWDTLGNGKVIGKWNELGSFNTSGRIWATEIDYANDDIYAFTDGGNLWKGDLDGSNWAILNDNFKISATNLLRKIGDRLIVSTYQWGVQGIFYSDDEGVTWTETTGLENVATWGNIFNAVVLNDAEHTIYALAYEWDYTNWWDIISLYRSTDLGESFQKITSYDVPTFGYADKYCLWSARDGDSTCYYIEHDNFCKLDSAGTPQLISALPFDDGGTVMLCGYEGATDKHFYVAHYNSDSAETDFYVSDDTGISWDTKGSLEEGVFSKDNFYCSQKNEGYLYYGCLDTWRSYNKGATWTRNNYWYEYYDNNLNNLHADIPYIRTFVDPVSTQETVLTSTDGGLFKSTNNGLTWTNITMENMRNAQYYDVYTYRWIDNLIFAGAQDQGYQRTAWVTDGHHYFDQLISGDYGHFVTRSGGDNLWGIYPGFAMYVYDAASSSNIYTWDFVGSGQLWMPPIMQDPFDDEVAWLGIGSEAGGAYLWRLERSGGSINGVQQTKNFSVGGGGSISAIAYSPINNNYWYLLTSNGRFYYSTDAGDNWTMTPGFTGPASHYFYGSSIEPSKTELGVVYIAGSGYSNPAVYVSYDNGGSFTDMVEGLPSTLVYDIALSGDDSLLFAATEIAPYVYVKSEHQWFDISAGEAPLQVYWSVDFVEGLNAARFGTYGRGAWEFKMEGGATNLSDQIHSHDMISVFPNPADAIINISVNAFIPDAVLKVIDMRGNILLEKNIGLNKNIPYVLNTSALNNGNYLILVEDKQKREKPFTTKFIVSR